MKPEQTSSALAIGFCWAGHALMHILGGLYLTVILVLEKDWQLGYDELLRLWTLGSLLIGVGAPLAGWLGDRWSEVRMLAVFFLLSGAGALIAGFSTGETGLWIGLAVMGLGCSIFHPVGMAMTVRHAETGGRSMAWFGISGSIGVALAGIIAGVLAGWQGWRAAFLVPGVVSLALGVAFYALAVLGFVGDRGTGDARPQAQPSRGDVVRAFLILTVTMTAGGMIANCMQIALPKLLELQLGSWLGSGVAGIGGLVTVINLTATLPQMLGGHLADRQSLKRVYLGALGMQTVMMLILASVGGLAVIAVASLVLMTMQIQAPAENLLLARYTPGRNRGAVFGARYVLSFGIGPLSVQMAAYFFGRFGGFDSLYLTLGGFAVCGVLAALLLPDERRESVEAAAD